MEMEAQYEQNNRLKPLRFPYNQHLLWDRDFGGLEIESFNRRPLYKSKLCPETVKQREVESYTCSPRALESAATEKSVKSYSGGSSGRSQSKISSHCDKSKQDAGMPLKVSWNSG